jgi:hypothetical protein
VCLLAYNIFGDKVSKGVPGDTANLYTYKGPKGIVVRGILNKEEVVMSQVGCDDSCGGGCDDSCGGGCREVVRWL